MEEKELSVPSGNDAFSSMLNGILSNPEMLSMVSSMAQQLKAGTVSTDKPEIAEAPPPAEVSAAVPAAPAMKDLAGTISTLAPLLSGGLGGNSKADNDRACLLRALKPYLSPGRCEAIEYIIKFSKLTDVLKNLS